MNYNEKKMLMLLITLIVLTVVIKGIPYLQSYYEDKKESINQLTQKTERLDKLLKKQKFWKKEFSKIISKVEKKQTQLLSAKSKELIAAKLQTLLKKIAKKTGIQIESARLPDFLKNDNWLVIYQNISIKGSSKGIYDFLKLIETDNKKLIINNIDLRANRNALRGSLTVVAFSQLQSGNIESLQWN